MTFADQVIEFTKGLRPPDITLPAGFSWLFPYDNPETMAALSAFYRKFYTGSRNRVFLFGINPGRFGAGVTGVPFTDPIRLETECGIPNPFAKKPELSSSFVWQFIHAAGGPAAFCERFYITSLSPLGFVQNGKNINYYDNRGLEQAVEPFIVWNIRTQLDFGAERKTAICMGEGQNYRYFSKINQKHAFFSEIIPLPHPRWVMQYRRRQAESFVQRYLDALQAAEG